MRCSLHSLAYAELNDSTWQEAHPRTCAPPANPKAALRSSRAQYSKTPRAPQDRRMPSYGIEINVGFPSEYERALAVSVDDAEALFPNQVQAIASLAERAHAKWLSYAMGAPLPNGRTIRPRTSAYARSIKLEEQPDGYRIYSDGDVAPHNSAIEEGRPAWDMHDLLRTSRKTRIGKDGTRYLIIPFEHGTPTAVVVGNYGANNMGDDVYSIMKGKEQSRVTGSYMQQAVNFSNVMVRRNTYQWGGRLTLNELASAGLDPSARATQNMVGMVRMDSGGGSAATRSNYITFRVLSEKSTGWKVPEQEGAYPARAVMQWIESVYGDLMQYALELDVERIKSFAGVD